MTDIESVQSRFLDAVGTAECARDMLVYAMRDVAKLARKVRDLNGRIITGDDYYWHSFALVADVAKIDDKLKAMLDRIDAMLGPAVVAEREMLHKQFS